MFCCLLPGILQGSGLRQRVGPHLSITEIQRLHLPTAWLKYPMLVHRDFTPHYLYSVTTLGHCTGTDYLYSTQLALPSDFSQVSRETEVCVAEVKDWMNKNTLKLSEEKTELLVVGDHTRLCEVKKEPLTFGPNAVPFQTSAKYLGVHLQETLSMKEQVTSLCRSSYFHLHKIASIRISDTSTVQLVSSLILSRLDYCNSTLSGLPSSSLNRLQKVQNNAARLVLHKRKLDHVTPLLEKLHWLPVEARIHYKIATLAFKYLDNSLPPYLSKLLHTYQPSRTLQSSSEKLLKVPKTNLKSA